MLTKMIKDWMEATKGKFVTIDGRPVFVGGPGQGGGTAGGGSASLAQAKNLAERHDELRGQANKLEREWENTTPDNVFFSGDNNQIEPALNLLERSAQVTGAQRELDRITTLGSPERLQPRQLANRYDELRRQESAVDRRLDDFPVDVFFSGDNGQIEQALLLFDQGAQLKGARLEVERTLDLT